MNLNVITNDAGFARRYLVITPLLPPGLGQPAQNKTFDCGPESYPTESEILWESAFRQYGLFFYKIQLHVQIQLNGYQYFKEGALFASGHGIIWKWDYAQGDFGQASFPGSEIPITRFFSPDWFDAQPNAAFIHTFYKLWADGPPH
jgi:hypothetical protein